MDKDLKEGFNGDLESDLHNDNGGEFSIRQSNMDRELDQRIFQQIQLKSFSQAENELRKLHGHVAVSFNKKPM